MPLRSDAEILAIPGLDPHVVNVLHRQQVGIKLARDILFSSSMDLIELLGLTKQQAEQLHASVAAYVSPAFKTVLELRMENAINAPLPIGLLKLDEAMKKGLPSSSLIEFVGPAGVGKSQMCFQLTLMVAAPLELGGLGSGIIYIDTENKFSSQRIAEMARTRWPFYFMPCNPDGKWPPDQRLDQLMDRIKIICPKSTSDLQELLKSSSFESVVLQSRVRLVVVDSVAALTRGEFGGGAGGGWGSDSIMMRQEAIGGIASRLKYLAECIRIPVVVTNQVTTKFGGNEGGGSRTTQAQPSTFSSHARHSIGGVDQGLTHSGPSVAKGGLVAALGTKWSHCVNVRFVLERVGGDRRFIKVVKSPSMASVALEYEITQKGLEQVDGEVPESIQLSFGHGDVNEMTIRNEIDYGWEEG